VLLGEGVEDDAKDFRPLKDGAERRVYDRSVGREFVEPCGRLGTV
jgi:hypothetical protein